MAWLAVAALLLAAVTFAQQTGSYCEQDGWTLIFEDEFEGTDLNGDNWNVMEGRDEGTLRQALGTRDSVAVKDGNLILTTSYVKPAKAHSANCSTLLHDTYFDGGIIVGNESANNVGDCCRMCHSNPLCGSFVYMPNASRVNAGRCHMKSADAVHLKSNHIGYTAGFVSGAGMYKSGAVVSAGQAGGSTVPVGHANQSWKYGRFCVKARLPGQESAPVSSGKSQGIWPAHWLMPDVSECWPTRGEIDIMEMINGDGVYHGTYHWSGDNSSCDDDAANGGQVPAPSAWASEYHEYALEWDDDHMYFVVDGAVKHIVLPGDLPTYGGPIPTTFYDVPYYWLLNTAVGDSGSWAGLPGPNTVVPTYHYIDYVRVAQKQGVNDKSSFVEMLV